MPPRSTKPSKAKSPRSGKPAAKGSKPAAKGSKPASRGPKAASRGPKAASKAPRAPPPGSKRAATKKPTAPRGRTRPSVSRPVEDERAKLRAMAVAKAGLSKKAEGVLVLDVRGLSSVADYFVILSGSGPRQVNALADTIADEMQKQGSPVLGSEGQSTGTWVLLDFGDVVAHIFEPETRLHYDLEGNWADAPRERVEA